MAQDSRFLGSARVIAACTLVSRVTGLARDMLLNFYYGQGWVQDAFNYGFLIPNLFRRLFGEGALSAVFVPTFTEVLDREGRPAAWVLLGRVTGLMSLVLAGLTILLELALLIVWLAAPGGAMRTLQIGLTAVMLPFMISICLLALFSSILNCLRHFTMPALMPIVLNLMNMFGVVVVGDWFIGGPLERQIHGVAWSVLAASVMQIFIIMPVLRRHGVCFRLSLDTSDPAIRGIMRVFFPILLGQGILLISVFLDAQICTFLTRGPNDPAGFSFFGRFIAYPLEQGALSAVNNAQRLYQFPLGVLAISLATAAFPLFSLYASRGDLDGLRSSLAQSLRVAVYEGLPSGVVMIVLAEPIISLLFEHGRFGPAESARAAAVLRWYGVGMAAFCCQHILLRGFYSLKDTLTPMWISCYLVILNIAISLAIVWHPRVHEAAFGISTTITSWLHVMISTWLLRRRMGGRIGAREVASSAARTAVASVGAGLAAWASLKWMTSLDLGLLGVVGRRAVLVFVPLLSAMACYLLISLALRMEETGWLVRRQAARSGPPNEAPPTP